MTSGITSGALTMPENSVRPAKRLYLTSANAARVPRITEKVAVKKAILRLSHRPPSISLSFSRPAYQRVVKPAHWLGTGESLNEYTTSATMGMYRNTKPAASQPLPKCRATRGPSAVRLISRPPALRPGSG